MDERDGKISFLVDDAYPISAGSSKKAVQINIPRGIGKEVLTEIGKVLKENKGDQRAQIIIPNGGNDKVLDLPYTINYSEVVERKINHLLADNN